MYATGNKKMLNMLILDILKEYSDEDHRLTQQEIIRLLKSNYDMECDRRSVKSNVLCLRELGYEISMEDGYYLESREFEDAELRMLIDSVLFSKSLTQKQSKTLIEKLRALGNRYFPAKVTHICNLPELQTADNKHLMYSLDAINDAISLKKKISFVYNSYGSDFKLHPRREEEYIVNPYQMVANNGKYYLIGNYDKYDNISHYRLDKMTCVKILDEKIKPSNEVSDCRNGFNLPKHMAEHMYMFSGRSVTATMDIPSGMMNEMVDWFGKDFTIFSDNDDVMRITVKCNRQALIYWSLQYGAYATVVAPQDLRQEIKNIINDMQKRYE